MRRVSGKLLWLQEKTRNGEFATRLVANSVTWVPLKADRVAALLLAMCDIRCLDDGSESLGQTHLLDEASRHRVKSILKSGSFKMQSKVCRS